MIFESSRIELAYDAIELMKKSNRFINFGIFYRKSISKINTEDFKGSCLSRFQFRHTERREKPNEKKNSRHLEREYIFPRSTWTKGITARCCINDRARKCNGTKNQRYDKKYQTQPHNNTFKNRAIHDGGNSGGFIYRYKTWDNLVRRRT